MIDSSTFTVIEEDGSEKEMDIIFTFELEEKGKNIVVYADPLNEEGEVYASSYDENGNLEMIEDPEEWEMINEILQAFLEEMDSDDEQNEEE